jgi:Mitochondrial carrier protein
VKTIVQNTEGDEISSIEVVKELYESGGVGAFFDGLTPKMLRAAVNHAVTFWVYDLVSGAIAS